MRSEESVEQNRGSMDKNRIVRPTRPDERANDREVQGHQGSGWEIRRACGEGGRSYLGRSALRLGNETEDVVRRPDRGAEVSRGHSVCWVACESGGLKSLQRSDEGRLYPKAGVMPCRPAAQAGGGQ